MRISTEKRKANIFCLLASKNFIGSNYRSWSHATMYSFNWNFMESGCIFFLSCNQKYNSQYFRYTKPSCQQFISTCHHQGINRSIGTTVQEQGGRRLVERKNTFGSSIKSLRSEQKTLQDQNRLWERCQHQGQTPQQCSSYLALMPAVRRNTLQSIPIMYKSLIYVPVASGPEGAPRGGGHHQLDFTLVNVKMVTLKGTSIPRMYLRSSKSYNHYQTF